MVARLRRLVLPIYHRWRFPELNYFRKSTWHLCLPLPPCALVDVGETNESGVQESCTRVLLLQPDGLSDPGNERFTLFVGITTRSKEFSSSLVLQFSVYQYPIRTYNQYCGRLTFVLDSENPLSYMY
jgi:hypothetical protein